MVLHILCVVCRASLWYDHAVGCDRLDEMFRLAGHACQMKIELCLYMGTSCTCDRKCRSFSGVSSLCGIGAGFAAFGKDGGMASWGNIGTFIKPAPTEMTNVKLVMHTGIAGSFAALNEQGAVVTWGNTQGFSNYRDVQDQLCSGVVSLSTTGYAFAALKECGGVITWGWSSSGGNSDSVEDSISSQVTSIYSNEHAFAALKVGGDVVVWGKCEAYPGVSNVTKICSTRAAFAALCPKAFV